MCTPDPDARMKLKIICLESFQLFVYNRFNRLDEKQREIGRLTAELAASKDQKTSEFGELWSEVVKAEGPGTGKSGKGKGSAKQ